ncbi:c-type heme family protein [Lysobacter hankyongensis]|uniref:Tll0287-like domain-containing protein n=1 Tax=Lysobacter hankyongensis TaxID=1176535 RepID=A0ABP9C2F6_9GAMM
MTLPKIPRSVLALAALAVAGIYFFVTAPADLDDASATRDVPVETLFRLLDAENASIRAIYTGEIVTPGLKIGLKYREDWKTKDIHAGPLPALLLRETANRLQQRVPEVNLFLGSTYPIEASNMFKGAQSTYFAAIERDRKPRFFRDESTGRYTAMFPDIASAPACVSCHNDHAKSPRKDWKQNDVMGATTWSFARKTLSTDEVIEILAAYRASAMDAYGAYLKKSASFDAATRPQLGARWPKEGLYLPDAEAFRKRVEEKNSIASLNLLLQTRAAADRVDAQRRVAKGAAPSPGGGAGAPDNAGTAP